MVAVSGLEVLLERPPDVVRGQRLGLVTNPAAVDRELRLSIDRLWNATNEGPQAWRLTRLFGPEHGVRGDVPAGGRVPDAADPLTGLPVSSLYGSELRPTAAMLADVDVLVVDLQDVGARFYTYQSTVAGCLQSGAEQGRPVLLLDRPNPVGGLAVEGPLLEAGYESFVGRRGQPVRHGLSLGELARATNEAEGIGADLTVLPVEGWQRGQWWDETGMPWVGPSPNLPTLDTATVYPGTCLLEGTLLSEGRGTARPFEVVGAPWIEPYRWAGALTERGLPGVRFRPLWFQPVASKHAGVRCGGVQLHVTDREAFRPVATGVHLIETARRLWPAEFGWRGGGEAGEGSRPARRGAFPEGGPQAQQARQARQAPPAGKVLAIDRLYGGPGLRERIDAGEGAEAIIASWDVAPFEVLRQQARLYT
jgi:uncharacterized protein YbbC (DUF1343 family)